MTSGAELTRAGVVSSSVQVQIVFTFFFTFGRCAQRMGFHPDSKQRDLHSEIEGGVCEGQRDEWAVVVVLQAVTSTKFVSLNFAHRETNKLRPEMRPF